MAASAWSLAFCVTFWFSAMRLFTQSGLGYLIELRSNHRICTGLDGQECGNTLSKS